MGDRVRQLELGGIDNRVEQLRLGRAGDGKVSDDRAGDGGTNNGEVDNSKVDNSEVSDGKKSKIDILEKSSLLGLI